MTPRASGNSGIAFDTIYGRQARASAPLKIETAVFSAAPLYSVERQGRIYACWQIFKEGKRVAIKKAIFTIRHKYISQVSLTSKPTQVSLVDFNQTLHNSRAMKNNRHVFFYIGGNSVLRVENTFWIFGDVFKIWMISIEQFWIVKALWKFSMSLNPNLMSKISLSKWRLFG